MANKTKVTTWITLDALRSLRDLAAAHQLAVSPAAADILERGLRERAESAGLGLLGPAVQDVVKREVGRMRDRLAHHIARTALESATARRLVFQLLVRQLTTEEARRLNQAAWTGSMDSLRKRSQKYLNFECFDGCVGHGGPLGRRDRCRGSRTPGHACGPDKIRTYRSPSRCMFGAALGWEVNGPGRTGGLWKGPPCGPVRRGQP